MVITFRCRVLTTAVRNAWPVWLAMGGIIVASLVGRELSSDTSAVIRYAGTVLQILGLATVAIGLSEVRKLFGKPSLPQKILAWFRQIGTILRPPKSIDLQVDSVSAASASDVLCLGGGAEPGASLDRRVAILEQNLNHLRDKLDMQVGKIKKELGALRVALDEDRQTREAETRKMADQVEELAVGGLHLESVGLLWLVLGVLGTSVPDEIVKLLQVLSLVTV